MHKTILSPLAAALLAGAASAQTPVPPPATAAPAPAPAAAANRADVASIDSILSALYDTISGPAGKKRDWARFRSLFREGARLIPTGGRPGGEIGTRVLDVEGYIERSAPFLEKEGFFESEVARRTDRFGHIAQVFSTYESRREPKAAPFARGINGIQLMNDGKRWWLVTVFWEGESDAARIPAEYLKSRADEARR